MFVVKLRALQNLRGDYGTFDEPMDFRARNLRPGQVFTVDNVEAERLEALGWAERWREPRVESIGSPKMLSSYENKALGMDLESEREARKRALRR